MPDAANNLFARKSWVQFRNLYYLMAASRKLLRKCEPDFLDRASHDRRNRKKRANYNRNFHAATFASFRISRSESTARLSSKRRAKHWRALARITSRSAGGVAAQR